MVGRGNEMELIYEPLFWIMMFLIIVGLFVAILEFPLIPNEIYGINVLKFIKLLGCIIIGMLLIYSLYELIASIKFAIVKIRYYKHKSF